MVPGSHNAVESQTLDPRMDMNSSDTAIDEFVCPRCGKKFGDLNSCLQHSRTRRHAKFCTYDKSSLPQCLNAHSMLPTHPTSGYCDIQGRRRTIEDFHTVHLHASHQFYGVFDGHLGNLASKYAASSFYDEVKKKLSNLDEIIRLNEVDWKKHIKNGLSKSFEDIHQGILKAVASSPDGVMNESGTTATILYVTELSIVVANVGDSRAVMPSWTRNTEGQEDVTPLQLTIDHVASSFEEQIEIKKRGGFVSSAGGVLRVNGNLAVSRSLGDTKLSPYLSRVPHVFALTKNEAKERCGQHSNLPELDIVDTPCFIVLASDGLWDVMSNQEAVDMVVQVIRANKGNSAYQEAAELLTQESYVRGSLDNIGVCVVAIS